MREHPSEILENDADPVYGLGKRYCGRKSIKEKALIERHSAITSKLSFEGTSSDIFGVLDLIEEDIRKIDPDAHDIKFYMRSYYSSFWWEVKWKCFETDEEFSERVQKYRDSQQKRKDGMA